MSKDLTLKQKAECIVDDLEYGFYKRRMNGKTIQSKPMKPHESIEIGSETRSFEYCFYNIISKPLDALILGFKKGTHKIICLHYNKKVYTKEDLKETLTKYYDLSAKIKNHFNMLLNKREVYEI